jgi:hypothetical protein
MKRLTRCAVAAVGLMCCLSESAALAQSDGADFHQGAIGSIREYVPADAVAVMVPIPSNLFIADVYRSVIEKMLRLSRTFRRQCIRIASEPRWTIHINVRSTAPQHGVRAMTTMDRKTDGGVTALIELFALNNDVELIAHELEHVLEQLDGIDLRQLAVTRNSGVRSLSADRRLYETRRANRVGAIVNREVHGWPLKR